VAFVHKDFPLLKHAWAMQAAVAGRHFAAVSPEAGVRWRQWIMANQRSVTLQNFHDKVIEFARGQGADIQAAISALNNPEYTAQVRRDLEEGVARGVAKTPTVFVNGQPFIERFSFEELADAIEKALR
jgi:protein-disulfide isomerase